MKKLEREMHEASRIYYEDMSEQNQEKVFALQKQIDDLHRARYAESDEHIS